MRLRLGPLEQEDAAWAALERELGAAEVAGARVTVEVDRPLTVPEVRRLEELVLDGAGAEMLQVVEVAEAAGEPPAAASGTERAERPPVRGVRAVRAPVRPRSEPLARGDEAEGLPTLLVKRTLRSGQRIRYGGNVVVLGDVNPGAEVIAAGDIVVLGTLRGVAHAGATGSTAAIVAAFRLQPTQIRVGQVIGRPPDGGAVRPDGPEVARVRDGVLVVERYVPQP